MLKQRFRLLEITEQLRAIVGGVTGDKFEVPGIIVVGSQSSGKSSVLEHATGLAFPRGEGMCTRVPTVVSVQGGCAKANLMVSANPEYNDDATFTLDPSDVEGFGNTITTLTNQLTNEGEISERPIYVRLQQTTGPTFTVTDVPGITCMAASGTQVSAEEIEKATTDLTRKMIGTSEETLVLVALPATDDFHNSKALQLAMKADPEGHRTIGVVTKIDNLPPGSDVVHRMSGTDLYLRHGYFAVRNRTQQEINDGMELAELDREEELLFQSDPVLCELPMEQRGMPRLLDKIYEEQGRKLEEFIPKMKTQIKDRIREESMNLSKLPNSLVTDAERATFLKRALGRIESDFRRCATSDTSVIASSCKVTNLSARVYESMLEMEDTVRSNICNFLGDDIKQELRDASEEGRGYDLSNFMQGPVFRDAFHQKTRDVFEQNGNLVIDNAKQHVRACFAALVDHHFGAKVLVSVQTGLMHCFDRQFDEMTERTRELVKRIVEAESSVTFTCNHYYAQTIQKFNDIVSQNAHHWRGDRYNKLCYEGVDEGESEGIPKDFMNRVAASFHNQSNDASAIRTMQISLHAYSKVVQKRFCDVVPAVIMKEMVMNSTSMITDNVLQWSEELIDKIKEDPNVTHRRQVFQNNLERLEKAKALLETV